MVAGTPLVVATLFGGGPDLVGFVVAFQGSAWLLMSLPAGVLVDRVAPLDALKGALLLAAFGAAVALAGVWSGALALFALGAFLGASATVVGFLAEGAFVQAIMPAADLPRANARLQLVQSAAMLAGPTLMGYAALNDWMRAAFGLALLTALGGLAISLPFGLQTARTPKPRRPLAEVAEGFRFVQGQPLLVGIVTCALFWNMAFFALLAVFVPFALSHIGLNAGQIGWSQAAMGIGSLLAAFTAAAAMKRCSPSQILLFGPATSCLASALVAASPVLGGAGLPALAFFLLGFGPILWFVCQNSIRQLVTPAGLLGRVGSVIQVAIYGVRSIGALAGGLTAAHLGFGAALVLVIALFALSTVSVLTSSLGRLREMPAPLAP
jgi:predicted MFS family arabinose efflux permease